MHPKIHLYTICWNEEYMLPYFFKHYDSLVDKYVFYDDGSTDNTLSILSNHPKVEIRTLPRSNNESYILDAQKLHNDCWKEARGIVDWVIYTAVDEFLYAPNLLDYIKECNQKGITAIPALGYQMISNHLPTKDESLLLQVAAGCPWNKMNKLSLFNPNQIEESNFLEGRHNANPKGMVVYPDKDLLLNLHYKYLDFKKTFDRHNELQTKLGATDKKNGWAHKYSWSKEKFKEDWDFFENGAHANIFDAAYNPDLMHSTTTERWWRK